MKANRNAIDNTEGISHVLGVFLMMPIIFMLISMMMFNMRGSIDELGQSQVDFASMVDNLDDVNFTINFEKSYVTNNIIWADDFEKEKLQWDEICVGFNSDVVPYHDEHYHNGAHSAKMITDSNAGDFSKISKPFAGQRYGTVSIEINFTVHPDEDYKIFSIYQDNNFNNGSIRLNLNNNKIGYFDGAQYIENIEDVNLFAHEHCWHHMMLVVDFDPDGTGTENPEYVGLIINGKSYDLSDIELGNPLAGRTPYYTTISFSNNNSGASVVKESYVDDFVFRNLSEYDADVVGNIPPFVLSTQPLNGATNVPVDQNVIVVFSETMDTGITPTLSQTGGFDPGNWTFQGWSTTSVLDDTATWTHDDWSDTVGFTDHTIFNNADSAKSVFAIDVDSDNNVDVLSASFLDHTIRWYENDGSESFIDNDIFNTADNATSVYAIDIDSDNDIDVLSASSLDHTIRWYENDGSESFTAHDIYNNADYAQSVFAIDFDGDNDIDVLSASPGDDRIRWYENDGSESFTAHDIYNNADGAYSVFAIDVDGDNDMDVLSASYLDDTIRWYENDGSESFTAHDIYNNADYATSVYAIDVDGDNDIDVLSTSAMDDTIRWYENDGSESFTAHDIYNNADFAKSVFTIDVDNDNDIDVLSASRDDDTIRWYENDGSESFTSRDIYANADGAFSVFAIDVDIDNDIDVLSASSADDTIRWYENDGGGSITMEVKDYRDTDGNLGSDSPYSWSFTTTSSGNNPPTASDNTINMKQDTTYTFKLSDFGYFDPESNPMDHIEIDSIANVRGSFENNGALVSAGSQISEADISAGLFTFTPDAGESGLNYNSFDFVVNDGTDDSISSYTITMHVTESLPWPMFNYDIERTGYKTGTGDINIATVNERWSTYLNHDIWSSPAIANIDNDALNTLEVVVGSLDDNVYCLDANDGSIIWTFDTFDAAEPINNVCVSPTLFDVDNDGDLEIYVGADNGYLYCLDHDGNEIWKYNTDPGPGGTFESHPVVGNIDSNNNGFEVVVGVQKANNNVICLDASGNGAGSTDLIWTYSTGAWTIGPPSLYDIDSDGDLDVFIGSKTNRVYCLDGTDTDFDTVTNDIWLSVDLGFDIEWVAPVIADLDNDNDIEIIMGITNTPGPYISGEVVCLDHLGNVLWRYGSSPCRATPAVADILGDADLEIIVGFYEDEYVCLKSDGTSIWTTNSLGIDGDLSSPIFGDIDGDGDIEAIVVSDTGFIYSLYDNDADGFAEEEWSYFVSQVTTSPALADVDGDGKLELLVCGKVSGFVYCLDGGAPVIPSLSFSSSTYNRAEGESSISITVELSAASADIITVDYRLKSGDPGNAIEGVDYNWGGADTLTFNPGITSQSFSIDIVDDGETEFNETVNFEIYNPTNANIGSPSETALTIQDNDFWIKAYGGSDWENSNSIETTSDGGYIIAGTTASYGDRRVLIIKVDMNGNQIWAKHYDPPDAVTSAVPVIQQTDDDGDGDRDDGYIVVSRYTNLSLVLKLNSDGTQAWGKTYDRTLLSDIIQTSDGGFIASGKYHMTMTSFIIKLDQNGLIEWAKTYGGMYFDSIRQTDDDLDGDKDDGYIAVGEVYKSGNDDGQIVKIAQDGTVEWKREYNWTNSNDRLETVRQTSDNGYIVTGSIGTRDRGVVCKLQQNGAFVWGKIYKFGQGPSNSTSNLDDIEETSDGGFVFTAHFDYKKNVSSPLMMCNGLVVKTDNNGNQEWVTATWGDECNMLNSVEELANGGYVATGMDTSWCPPGHGYSDCYILRLNHTGEVNSCSIITKVTENIVNDTSGDVSTIIACSDFDRAIVWDHWNNVDHDIATDLKVDLCPCPTC